MPRVALWGVASRSASLRLAREFLCAVSGAEAFALAARAGETGARISG